MHAHQYTGDGRLRLDQVNPSGTPGATKEEAAARTEALATELAALEDLLYFAGSHSLLVLFQGRDTSGKDGAIRKVLDTSNAQSTRVEAFKVPTEEELAHDFLWRVHARTPRKGSLVLFNRSHYEDVLVVRVHGLVPEHIWSTRYAHIRHFEELLIDSGTILVKFFLHISKEEQERRLLEREQEVEKAWKLSAGDWREREFWNDYTAAYEDALAKTATEKAPWTIVPANHKWYRNLVVLETIVAALTPHRQGWLDHLREIGIERMAEIRQFRKLPAVG